LYGACGCADGTNTFLLMLVGCVGKWWWVGSLHKCWSYEVIVDLSLAWGFVAPFKTVRKNLLSENLISTLHKCWSYEAVVNLSVAWGFVVPFMIARSTVRKPNTNIAQVLKLWGCNQCLPCLRFCGSIHNYQKRSPIRKPNTNFIMF
jgi:hypothetical protein